jgi:hypothetical protein
MTVEKSRKFEDLFTEFQADMVSVCLEYVNDIAEKIYIYVSCEGKLIAADFFFRIDGSIRRRHALNENSVERYDVSEERQYAVLEMLTDDVKKIKKLCEESDKPMPAEFKLIYDVQSRSLDASYQYESMRNRFPDKTPLTILDEWISQICQAE